jgi:hypothetical protein
MEELVNFIVRGLVDNPDEVHVNMVEGESSVILELSVHRNDVELVQGDDGATLMSLKHVLSAASGRRKAILELVESTGGSDTEE